MSFCQESQRYCSYNLGKFDGWNYLYTPQNGLKNITKDTAKSYDSLDKSKRDWLLEMPIEDAVSKHMICLDRAVNCWYDNLKKKWRRLYVFSYNRRIKTSRSKEVCLIMIAKQTLLLPVLFLIGNISLS